MRREYLCDASHLCGNTAKGCATSFNEGETGQSAAGQGDAQKAQNTCKADACVTATAPKSLLGKIGSWFSKGAASVSYAVTAFIITHSHSAMEGNKSSFNYWSKKSNEEIIKSLNPGGKEPMQVRMEVDSETGTTNMRVLNGNMRLSILQSRGADLRGLNPETLPPVMLEPLGMPKGEPGAEPEPTAPIDIPE